jgi:hypothetical protein
MIQISLLLNNIIKLNTGVPLYVTLHIKNTLPARWMENFRKKSSLLHCYPCTCSPKTAPSVWTSENHLEPCSGCRMDGRKRPRAFRSLNIMNICPAIAKHSTSLPHFWLIHYTLQYADGKFQLDGHFVHSNNKLQLALHNRWDSHFLKNF